MDSVVEGVEEPQHVVDAPSGASRAGTGGTGGTYEAFVERRSGALHRSAFLLTGTTQDAEDLVQTTLVKLYVAWRRAVRADSIDAYAHRTLVNAFLSGRRPARWHREKLVTSLPEVPAPQPDHDGALDLWSVIGTLSPRQRAVVVLRYYDGLSEAEIARVMGVSRGTVKSTASAALRRLRERMEDGR